MEKTQKDHLEDTLDELVEDKLTRFKDKLGETTFQGRKIAEGVIEKAKSVKEAVLLISTYSKKQAAEITVSILKAINEPELAEELEKKTRAVVNVEGVESSPPHAGVPGEVEEVIEDPVSLLRTHKVRLIEVLSKHPGLVVQGANSQGLLSIRKYRNIRSIRDPNEKTEKLLDHIIGKGSGAAQAFIDLLRTLQNDFPALPAELIAGVPGEVDEVIEDPVSLLRTHKVRLIEVLSNDPSPVEQGAHSQGLLSDRKYKHIRSINDPNEKIAELLDFIIGKGSGVVQQFIELLKTLKNDFPALPAELLGVNRN